MKSKLHFGFSLVSLKLSSLFYGLALIGLVLFLSLLIFPEPLKANDASFDAWIKGEMGDFQQYKDKRDKEFTSFLKKEWKAFQISKGLVMDETPKPVVLPVAPPKKPVPKPSPVDLDVTKPVAIPTPKPIKSPKPLISEAPVPPKPIVPPKPVIAKRPTVAPKPIPKAPAKKGELVKADFFGTDIAVNIDRKILNTSIGDVGKNGIADFWSVLSLAEYDGLVSQAEYYKRELSLNDWGYTLLLGKIGEMAYEGRKNEAKLLIWFLLSKSGYKARVGYDSNSVYLLLPARQTIYGSPYFTMDGDRLFVANVFNEPDNIGRLYTYKGNYPNADRVIDLSIHKLPSMKKSIKDSSLRFKYKGKEYSVGSKYDRNIIDFLGDYPQTDLQVYFSSSLSLDTHESIQHGLKPIVDGKSELETVNIILRFVQTAFAYKTDGEQFGREKYFFPEEVFFYPYSDCEDRSIIFAYLVKRLTGLEVVGLDFPGHIATAVRFSGNVEENDYVIYRGGKYIICDPTYINADVGMRMPQFKGAVPTIIAIE